MKTLIFALILKFNLVFLLSGCKMVEGFFNHEKTPEVFEDKPYGSVNFPLDYCGDFLPQDERVYPITLHPVYVKNSSDLNFIRYEVCKNAVSPRRSEGIPEGFNLGYFSDLERANQMAELIEELNVGTASVETAIVIRQKPPSFSVVVKASQLINSQLFSRFIKFLESNPENIELNAILPTYIPPGFQIKDVVFGYSPNTNPAYIYYAVSYSNSLGSCFQVSGTSMRGGAGVGDIETLEVYAPALGEVTIMYAKSDRENLSPWMSIEPIQKTGIIPTKILYGFSSVTKQENPGCTTTLSLNEAAKVVESLQYLNHPLSDDDPESFLDY